MRLGVEAAIIEGELLPGDVEVADGRIVSVGLEPKSDGGIAILTVRFEADIAAVTRNAEGQVVAGSLSDAVQTRDLWTFRRDTGARDPNWVLIETDEEE